MNTNQQEHDTTNNRQRGTKTTNILGSVFEDLPSPVRYDPSWYNNKLRGEFGQLGRRNSSGPVLPKSYHLLSEDLDELADTDDDSYLHSTIRSRSGEIFGKIESRVQSRGKLQMNIVDQLDDISPIAPASRNRGQNGTGRDGGMVTSPVTNEFDQLANEENEEGDNRDTAKWDNVSDKGGMTTKAAGTAPIKKGFRFGRKSAAMQAMDTSLPGGGSSITTTTTTPTTTSSTTNSSQYKPANIGPRISRQSKMFRPSLLVFGGNERDANKGKERDKEHHNASQRKSNTLLRRSTYGASKSRGLGFGRKAIVFEWSCDASDALRKVVAPLEKHFGATVTAEKEDEVRMHVPFNTEARNVLYSIVLSIEQMHSGSRVIVRRSFGDSLRGGGDEFDWLCAQIVERLREVFPTICLVFPTC